MSNKYILIVLKVKFSHLYSYASVSELKEWLGGERGHKGILERVKVISPFIVPKKRYDLEKSGLKSRAVRDSVPQRGSLGALRTPFTFRCIRSSSELARFGEELLRATSTEDLASTPFPAFLTFFTASLYRMVKIVSTSVGDPPQSSLSSPKVIVVNAISVAKLRRSRQPQHGSQSIEGAGSIRIMFWRRETAANSLGERWPLQVYPVVSVNMARLTEPTNLFDSMRSAFLLAFNMSKHWRSCL
ncbi:hypothetical protein RRG08_032072 [Elysia crispata]|uniref:Uncharacterized protein n=1 Tax=Elysia crispata TaxID=231223 RepID=A0AAE1DFX6_9GAST|nr:hypothetical protein RRG08_032072 [Elysia crispata]